MTAGVALIVVSPESDLEVTMANLNGTWTGRLIDVAGLEGSVGLTLRGRGGRVSGTFTATIPTQHEGVRATGKVSGATKGDKVELVVELEEAPVKITLRGDAFDCRDGGLGMKGTYDVAARRFSPLAGGVVVLHRPKKLRNGALPANAARVAVGK